MSSYPEEQKSSSNKTVIIVVSIVAGVILLLALVCGGFAYFVVSALKPAFAQGMKMVEDLQTGIMLGQQFLNELSADHPDDAYELMSEKYKKVKSLKEFKDMLAKHPAIVGSAVALPNAQPGGNTMMIPFTLTGPKGTVSGTLHLIKEGEEWKVDQISLPQ